MNNKIFVTRADFQFDLQRFTELALQQDESGNYLIGTTDDMNTLADYVNASNNCAGLIFKQTEDIDLSAIENFTPIGDYTNYSSFDGTFDGCGHTISNLKINSSSEWGGLFGYVSGGTIQNVNLINATVQNNYSGNDRTYTDALVGFLSGLRQ